MMALWKRLAFGILSLGLLLPGLTSRAEAANACDLAWVLREGACPGGGESCSVKSTQLSWVELDNWARNAIKMCNVDTEAEFEAHYSDIANLIVSTEIDTEAELEALMGAINLIVSGEIDTEAELEALLGDVTNVLTDSEAAQDLACTDCVDGSDLADNITLDAVLNIDSNTLVVDQTNDRVGVGTATPSQELHVKSTDAGNVALRLETDSSSDWDLTADNSDGRFKFNLVGGGVLNPVVTLDDATGNVGIGTASPGTELDVDGTVTATGLTCPDCIDQANVADDAIQEEHLKAVDAAGDEECLTYEVTTGDFEWQSCAAGAGDPVLIDGTAVGDAAGVDLQGGSNITITFNAGASPDTASFAVDDSFLQYTGGTMTGEFTADDLGIEFAEGDTLTDCSTFSVTGGGIFYDDSEGKFKKCQDNTLTDLDTGGAEVNDLTAAVTWANVPDANVDGASERDEVCNTTDLSSSCEINSNVINQDELASSITFAASDNIVLPIEAADQTVDGEIDFDTAEEVIEVGDDGVATLKFYPGQHTTEVNDLSASVTWANVPDANVDGSNERDEVCGTTDLSAGCEINAGVIDQPDIDDTDTVAANPDNGANAVWFGTTGLIFEGATNNTIETLLTAADPTTTDKTVTIPDETGTLLTSATSLGGDVSGTASATQVDDVQSATANTESADNNTTQVATTAFVQQEINGAGGTDLTCSSGVCNVDNPVTAATTASNLNADGVDALTEVAQGIKTAANDTDPLAVFTGGNPAGDRCVKVNSSGQLSADTDTCANLGPGGTPTQIAAGDSDITMADAGAGTATVTIDSSAVAIWDVGGLTIGGADVTDQLNLPISNDATTPTLAFGDGDTGFYESTDDNFVLSILGTARIQFNSGEFEGLVSDAPNVAYGAATATTPVFRFKGDEDTGIGKASGNQLSLISGAAEAMRLQTAASAVTYIDVTPGATGVGPTIAAAGETNLNLDLDPAGTGNINLGGYGSGSKTGTDAFWLAVDASGNIIEEAAPAGTGDVTDVGDCTGPACFTSGSPDAALTFDNATSGTVTLQTVAGALGTVTVSLPAETGTICTTGSVCTGYDPTGGDDLTDDNPTALSGVTTMTDGQLCEGNASTGFDCDVATISDAQTPDTHTHTDASITEADLASEDYGDFTCGAGADDCVLDTGVVDSTALASDIAVNSLSTDAADPADGGVLRLANAETICWEASPAGTDVCIAVDTSELLQITGGGMDAADLTSGTVAAARVGSDHIDNILEIASSLKSGSDATLMTGTAGGNGNCAQFDANGDIVDSGAGCGGGSGDNVTIDGVASVDPDFRSEGDIDSIRCTAASTPDASCVAAEDVIFRYNTNSINQDDLAATITMGDGDLIDFGTNISSATEGLMIPAHATSCASATAEGQVCWEEDANNLWIGDGSAAKQMNAASGPTQFGFAFNCKNCKTADSGHQQWKAMQAITLVRVSCSSSAGSFTMNLFERAENSPNTGTTGLLTSTLTCNSDTTADATTSFADSAIAADSVIAFGIITETLGNNDWGRAYVEYTVD